MDINKEYLDCDYYEDEDGVTLWIITNEGEFPVMEYKFEGNKIIERLSNSVNIYHIRKGV